MNYIIFSNALQVIVVVCLQQTMTNRKKSTGNKPAINIYIKSLLKRIVTSVRAIWQSFELSVYANYAYLRFNAYSRMRSCLLNFRICENRFLSFGEFSIYHIFTFFPIRRLLSVCQANDYDLFRADCWVGCREYSHKTIWWLNTYNRAIEQ